MSGSSSTRDNRRLIVRVLAREVIRLITDWAHTTGEDLIAVIMFTAIWTANVAHLAPRPALRYTELDDIPPDSLRTPVPAADLPDMLGLPRATVTVYVKELIAKGLVEETEGGLIVPSAVIARMESLDQLNVAFCRAHEIVARLRDAGLSFDDLPPANRK